MRVKRLLSGVMIIAFIGVLTFVFVNRLPQSLEKGKVILPHYNSVIGDAQGGGSLNRPSMAVEAQGGKVIVADTGNHVVKIFASNGKFITQVGEPGNGPGMLDVPYGIGLLGNGDFLVSDLGNLTVQEFNPSTGKLVRIWIDSKDGVKPGFIYSGSGVVLIGDLNNQRVLVYDQSGKFLRSFGEGKLFFPQGIGVDNAGSIWVADSAHYEIKGFDKNGKVISSFNGSKDSKGKFSMLKGLVVDEDNNLWVVNTGTHNIRVLSRDGRELHRFGNIGSNQGEFNYPIGISKTKDRILIADRGNNRIQVWKLKEK